MATLLPPNLLVTLRNSITGGLGPAGGSVATGTGTALHVRSARGTSA
jgi:hypothetical protein